VLKFPVIMQHHEFTPGTNHPTRLGEDTTLFRILDTKRRCTREGRAGARVVVWSHPLAAGAPRLSWIWSKLLLPPKQNLTDATGSVLYLGGMQKDHARISLASLRG